MPFTVPSDAVRALKPVRLPVDSSVIQADNAAITWPAASGDGEKGSIRVEETVLVARAAGGGHLILTVSQGEAGEEGAFHLSSFLAPSLPQNLLDKFLVTDLPEYLRDEPSSSLDVLVSVRSGTCLAQKFYRAVLQPLLATLGLRSQDETAPRDKTYNVTLTQDANTVKEFARQRWALDGSSNPDPSEPSKTETIILLSGDGGIVDLLNGVVPAASLPTIALVPLGTGNALFHSLHKPHYAAAAAAATAPTPPPPLALALRALLQGRAAPLPTFQASFSPGAHLVGAPAAVRALTGAIVASYGFHSQLVWESDAPAHRAFGARRFQRVAAALLRAPHGYRAAVATRPAAGGRTAPGGGDGGGDGGGGDGAPPFNYVLATMVSNLERDFTISPASEPLDGVLRLVHFGCVSGERTMEIMKAAYGGGKHVEMEGVGYQAVEEVRVTTWEEDARWRKVCIDGTIVELPQGGTMVVERSSTARVKVLVLDA